MIILKPSRDRVFEAIEAERDYQDDRWPSHKHSMTEYLVFIDHYVKKGFAAVSTQETDDEARIVLRKIGALAVAAMEENGVAFRE